MNCPYEGDNSAWDDNNTWRFAYDRRRLEDCFELSRAIDGREYAVIHLTGAYGTGKSSLFNRALVNSEAQPRLVDFHRYGIYLNAEDHTIAELIVEELGQGDTDASRVWEKAVELALCDYGPTELIFRVACETVQADLRILGLVAHKYHQMVCIETRVPMQIPVPRATPSIGWGQETSASRGAAKAESKVRPTKDIYVSAFDAGTPGDNAGMADLCGTIILRDCIDCPRAQAGRCLAPKRFYDTNFRPPRFPWSEAVAELRAWAGTHPLLLHKLCYFLDQELGYSYEDREEWGVAVEQVILMYQGMFISHVQRLYEALEVPVRDALHALRSGSFDNNAMLVVLRKQGIVFEEAGKYKLIRLMQMFLEEVEKGEKGEFSVGSNAPPTALIRELLVAAFTVGTMQKLCEDHSLFSPLVSQFSPQDSLEDRVGKVITFCRTQLLLDDLLTVVKNENPRQYAKFLPRLKAYRKA